MRRAVQEKHETMEAYFLLKQEQGAEKIVSEVMKLYQHFDFYLFMNIFIIQHRVAALRKELRTACEGEANFREQLSVSKTLALSERLAIRPAAAPCGNKDIYYTYIILSNLQ